MDGEEDVTFQQWQTTDLSKVVTQTLNVEEFIKLLVGTIDNLTSQCYIAKCQTNYLKRREEELPDNCALVLGNFVENYAFVFQDEIQSFHWSKLYCTLHPIVVYYKENGKLDEKSFCFISDDLEHDTEFVFELQRELVKMLKELLPTITEVQYFSDGCEDQYKNYKNMLNLCRHKEDFGIDATWVFFATSHGKSPYDGIGGTVKRITVRASLQRRYLNQILAVSSMLDFCKTNIPAIEFIYISKERMEDVPLELKKGFALGQTIPGIRSYHFFKPVGSNVVSYKRTAEDDAFAGSFSITVRLNDYVACRYDKKWWIGVVEEVDRVQ